MQRIISVFCALVLVLVLLNTAYAGVKKAPAGVVIDSSKVTVQKFDQGALKEFRADKDFNYNSGTAQPGQLSLWDRFWNWFWVKLFRGIGKHTSVQYILAGICVLFLVYIIFKVIGIDVMQVISGRPKETELAYSESLENINEINFDAEIEKALAQHNYRLAVRLLYLKCLKQLSDRHLVQWQIDKTNSAYLYELKDVNQQKAFRLLTRQFEYVWYGNFAIDKDAFGSISNLFQDFKKQLP